MSFDSFNIQPSSVKSIQNQLSFKALGKENVNTSNIENLRYETTNGEEDCQNVTIDNILYSVLSPRVNKKRFPKQHLRTRANDSLNGSLIQVPTPTPQENAQTSMIKPSTNKSSFANTGPNLEIQVDRVKHPKSKTEKMPNKMHHRSYSNLTNRSICGKPTVRLETMSKEDRSATKAIAKKQNITEKFEITEEASEGNFDVGQVTLNELTATINEMKKQFEEKYKQMEGKLKQSELTSEKMEKEKDRLQHALDRLNAELKQTKKEWAVSEEKKKEIENALKKEISLLASEFLQAKESAFGAESQKERNLENRRYLISSLELFNQFNTGLTSPSVSHTPKEIEAKVLIPQPKNLRNVGNQDSNAVKNVNETEKKASAGKPKYSFTSIDTSPMGSPRRVSEFFDNEMSLSKHLNNTASNPKKLLSDIKC